MASRLHALTRTYDGEVFITRLFEIKLQLDIFSQQSVCINEGNHVFQHVSCVDVDPDPRWHFKQQHFYAIQRQIFTVNTAVNL